MRETNRLAASLVAAAVCGLVPAAQAQDIVVSSAADLRNLADMSLEQLASIEVTSVSGRAQSLAAAAASIYVITGEDIRRSAATSLPEALRLAPNLEVAQLNSRQYAISARGFNNAIANKLLVLIDGRVVYSSLFAGVFWDFHDVLLEDVARIEVISGPGGTIWGANAVNGVINVVTKPAEATQGWFATATRARDQGQQAARWGGKVGDGFLRVYAMALDSNNTHTAAGAERPDANSKQQLGFRGDWDVRAGSLTLQGDLFQGGELPATNLSPKMWGGNLLARLEGRLGDGSGYRVQGYVDAASRDETATFRNTTRTAALEFRHELVQRGAHKVLWGTELRQSADANAPNALVAFLPASRTLHWANVFAQDQIAIGERLELTLGAKAERNSYTGIEFMPSVRASYAHSPSASTWAALSRAVRAPARIDRDFFIPAKAPFAIAGGPAFESEVATVLEAGHRRHFGSAWRYDVSVFRQQYDGLRGGSGTVPSQVANRIAGHIDGLEAWGTWQAMPRWRLSAGYLYLHKSLHFANSLPGDNVSSIQQLGNDPRHQIKLRSQWDVTHDITFDLALRHVAALPAPLVPAYTAVDGRLAWAPSPTVQVALVGQNLTHARHAEFNAANVASQLPRRVYLQLTWRMP